MNEDQIEKMINYLDSLDNAGDAHIRFMIKRIESKVNDLKGMLQSKNKTLDNSMSYYQRYEEILDELRGIFS